MNVVSRSFLLLLLLGCPALALAAGVFEVQPGDKSVEWLGMIFGNIANTPVQGSNPLFGNMVYIFNQVVFGLGVVIIGYTAAMGAINTAHEGQFLGKDWHPILVPLRAGVGILLLLPQSAGYNYMQIIVMWFIVQGIGAANSMWTMVIRANQTDGNIHDDTRKNDLTNAYETVRNILKSEACIRALNGNAGIYEGLDREVLVRFHDRLKNRISWGRQDVDEEPICGYIDLTSADTFVEGTATTAKVTAVRNIFAQAVNDAADGLGSAAIEVLMDSPNYSRYAGTLVDAARTLSAAAKSTSDIHYDGLRVLNSDAEKNGWILAGSYYYQLTQNGKNSQVQVNLKIGAFNTGPVTKLGPTQASVITNVATNADTYFTKASQTIVTVPTYARAGTTIILNPRNMGDEGGSIFAAIFGSLFEDITQDLMRQMSGAADPDATPAEKTKFQNDPLVSLTAFGSNLTTSTENVFFAALGLAFALWLVSTPMSCLQPLGHAFNFLLTIIMPIAVLMISLLWVAGLTLGLYIPMIPYLVFTFSALSWFIMVIEAMLAAPLIALTLIVPSEDEIGKAGYAIAILLGIFLRPALMILGFIMAIQLLIVAIGMLNAGFWSTMLAATGGSSGIGIFGLIAVLLLYAGIALGMVHEAFSLIYLVPNKVMRWIGGDSSGDDPMKKVQELKGSVQKGAGIGGGLMKSSLKAFKK
ncbi:MAG: DotA/TraY family protein [Candidatus Berkiella sp.]